VAKHHTKIKSKKKILLAFISLYQSKNIKIGGASTPHPPTRKQATRTPPHKKATWPTKPNPTCLFMGVGGATENKRIKDGRERLFSFSLFRSTALIYPLVCLSKVARKKGRKKTLTLNLDKLFFSSFLSVPTL